VVAHLEKYCPRPFTFEAKVEHYGDGMKVGLNDQSSIAAIEAGKIVYGRQPPIIWEGASIPILPAIAKAAESEIVMIGLCTVTNGMHSPDENFSLQQIESGFIYSAVLLQNLARY
jgi:acetylornithine deacetylase/succinyl-diaminopimelate desuccinylase-like protein